MKTHEDTFPTVSLSELDVVVGGESAPQKELPLGFRHVPRPGPILSNTAAMAGETKGFTTLPDDYRYAGNRD